MDSPRRGVFEVTELGHKLTAQHGNQLNETIVKSQPKYIEHQQRFNERRAGDVL